MPSRKRNKGKERKAKKAEKEAIDDAKIEKAANNTWRGWAHGFGEKFERISDCDHG
jgi:hypothetical protein